MLLSNASYFTIASLTISLLLALTSVGIQWLLTNLLAHSPSSSEITYPTPLCVSALRSMYKSIKREFNICI